MKKSIFIIVIALTFSPILILNTACNSTSAIDMPAKLPVNDQGKTSSTTASDNTAKPDKVELIYFHTKNPCHCMAIVGDNIKYAVDTYFKDEQASGKVKLTMIVSDNPANAELVKKYDAMLFTLFVKEIRGNTEKIYPVSDIWNMTGDDNKDALVKFIKTALTNILEGKSS